MTKFGEGCPSPSTRNQNLGGATPSTLIATLSGYVLWTNKSHGPQPSDGILWEEINGGCQHIESNILANKKWGESCMDLLEATC